MVFNSIQFLFFFIIVYSLYRILSHKYQNRMLLVASYIFYGFWDWRFLSLILLSTIVDYFCALKIDSEESDKSRRLYLFISVATNLSILGFFKYFNFFAENLQGLAGTFGFGLDYATLNIILPVGISFYTFQTMSYTIDIYRRQMRPTKDFFDFALFVAFFPQLVAGPIERAKRLLPQITHKRKITSTQMNEGVWLIFWGLFKKIFIADNLAIIVDEVFLNSGGGALSAGAVLMASYAFAFQIYGDFSGYSDIARGLSKLMGIEIMINFRFPYFVTNPRDFWRNWHISLSTWLRDYLYIPLGGSRKGPVRMYINIFITMLLGGLWHGAAWTFILWGAFHATLLCVHRIIEPALRDIPDSALMRFLWFPIRLVFMFHLTCLGWLIFRAESFSQLALMAGSFVTNLSFDTPLVGYYFLQILFFTAPLLILQIFKNSRRDMYVIFRLPGFVRWPVYIALYFLITTLGEFGVKQFIYFQF